MSLKDILAARKQNAAAPTLAEDFFKPFSQVEVEDEDDKPEYYLAKGTYLPNTEVNKRFLAVYTPLISYPYDLFHNHFEFATWMLDDNVHVLNTFNPIHADYLFNLYMEYNPPKCAADLHRLYVTITRICLVFPPVYLKSIEDIIRKSEKLAKNSEMRQTKRYSNSFLAGPLQ